ncbi:MAG: sensor histidine kinase KdpD [Pseudomonadota bacterium]
MNMEHRPDPDALLAQVEAEERGRGRGRLKLFFGYAAGVGKTYSMLEAARRRKAEGVDVVAGYVETHGRAETDALLEGLDVIPRRQMEDRGTTLPEMDLDAILTRKPQLALVDELAHTNAPGSRHGKRWQDIEELLAAGMDIYSTLNVQHIESLNDVVAQITGITVRETIPDRVLDEASEIALVDLPPDDLLQRLREGKVYVPEQAARAIKRFFKPGNLTALRELSLRRAADRVDEEMWAYMEARAIPGPWPATERVMVCISGSPFSDRLIRTGRRLSDRLKAEWFTVYVEGPGADRLSQENRQRVWRDLRLAEVLGAKTATLTATSIAEAVVDFARRHNVTKIVIGRPIRPRWRELLRGQVVDQIIRLSHPIDVYVISSVQGTKTKSTRAWSAPWGRERHGYGLSAVLVAAATLLGAAASSFLSPTNLVMIYLLAVVYSALKSGFWPAIVTALLSVLAFDFFFVPPHLTFAVSDGEYLITFGALFTVGAVISRLVSRARQQTRAIQVREEQTAALYALSRDLAAEVKVEAILQAAVHHITEMVEAFVAVLLPEGQSLKVALRSPGLVLAEPEKAVALWTYHNRQPAGRGTDTLASARMLFLPLLTAGSVVGVLGVKLGEGEEATPQQRRLLEAFANQTALAIERANLAHKAEETQLLQATEKLERALLSSVSHDLRTPLASVTGALSSLREEGDLLSPTARRELLDTAREEADRLNRFVGNLLDMTRLEAGALQVRKEPCDAQELVGATLNALGQRLSGRAVVLDVPSGLPLASMDLVLMTQVLTNILENALKYSPSGSPVDIKAGIRGSWLEIAVADRGPGIPEEDLQRIFDKFYRVSRPDGTSGTGLGLVISKGLVDAHKGRVWAENRPEGGARVIVALPLDPARDGEEAMST